MTVRLAHRPVLVAQETRWVRALPFAAHVAVAEGQHVGPDAVIAQGAWPREPRVVPLSALLRVRAHEILRHLRKHPGESFRSGELLARRGGLFARSYVAPFGGTFIRAIPDRGAVVLAPAGAEVALLAHVEGTVERVLPARGAVLRAVGLLCQGVAGVGAEAHGPLIVRAAPNDRLTPDRFDEACRGAIVVGGHLAHGARAAAAARGVAALVVGAVAGDLLEELTPAEAGPAVVVTHWLGAQGMPPAAHGALAALEGRVASVLYRADGARVSAGAPSLFIAGASSPAAPAVGAIVAGEARGEIATAIEEEASPARFGPLRGTAVRVRLADDRLLRLPAWAVERWTTGDVHLAEAGPETLDSARISR